MESKEIEVNGKKFKIHELLAIEFDEIQKIENKIESIVALIKNSADMTDEDYNILTLKERGKVMDEINQLNGWSSDFQKSETEKKS